MPQHYLLWNRVEECLPDVIRQEQRANERIKICQVKNQIANPNWEELTCKVRKDNGNCD